MIARIVASPALVRRPTTRCLSPFLGRPVDKPSHLSRLISRSLSTGFAMPVASPLPEAPEPCECSGRSMAGLKDVLFIECRMALGLTQREFGDLLGRTKRTVQRWEDHGAILIESEVEALVRALHRVRPDLAARVAAAADTTLERLGIDAAQASSPAATSNPIDSVVQAAADAMGLSAEAIRPA